MQVLQNAFTKAISIALPDQQEILRTDMSTLRSIWEQLNMDLNTVQARINSILNRWEDHAESYSRFDTWLSETENLLNMVGDTKGELGEMKTLLERYKHLKDEAIGKKSDLDRLVNEAVELSEWAHNHETIAQTSRLVSRWEVLGHQIDEKKSCVENEIDKYHAYHAALQETEKWLLQVSFQLMSHNSLYIVNKEQIIDQIKQHDDLMSEIENYESVLEALKAKGLGQISRYESVNPSIKTAIETQLQNVRDSYNSLLSTALQIKSRLGESLSKFQEYENALESIMKNLNMYRPEVEEECQAPLDTLDGAKASLERSRILYNKLQNEKSRLAVAVEACGAAAACVSRPSSPLDAPPVQVPVKEVELRNGIEDLIDQVIFFT